MKIKKIKIQDWAKEDRPRERLINKGRDVLSNIELLAILIGSGTQHVSAVDLARHILQVHNNSLTEIAKKSVAELSKFKGIGQARAVTIVSAMELATRINYDTKHIKKISSSLDAYKIIKPILLGKLTEEFWVILLNSNNHVIKSCQISKGGLSRTIVDAKVVFKHAFEHNATSVILVHNHPSGNSRPSEEDIRLTEKLKSGALLLDIRILDHIIFCDTEYYSFTEQTIIKQ